MFSQTDIERERYESRRKAQLDFNTGMKAARIEGVQIGLAKGEQIGRIHLCEKLLMQVPTPSEDLARMSLDELMRWADTLQEKVLKNAQPN